MKCISEQAQEQDSTTLCSSHRPEINHIYAAPNSDVFYKSKRGTHGEPSPLKPARKEVDYGSLSLFPPFLGSGGPFLMSTKY